MILIGDINYNRIDKNCHTDSCKDIKEK